MKKRLTFIIIICTIICISTSCARKINGATPHRRDRNCGCENLSPTCPADHKTTTGQCSREKEVPLPPIVGNGMVMANSTKI